MFMEDNMQRCNKLIIIISIIIFSVVIGIQYKTINAYEIENKNSKIIRDEFNLVEENNKVIDILTFNDFHGKVLESEKNIGASKLKSILKEYKIIRLYCTKICSVLYYNYQD